MSATKFHPAQLLITSGAFALVGVHLAWEMAHGGVVSHHFLGRSDMPAISNWWGILLVPALAWFVASRVLGRAGRDPDDRLIPATIGRALPAFGMALVYGGLLAASFSFGFGLEKYLFFGLFLIGLALPIYRGECVLGFVLGMMFTFGGILPLVVAAFVATVSWAAHAMFRCGKKAVQQMRQDNSR